MPGSVVLQDELVEILDDYPLTTEMNEALSGKAGKDWVEEELAKYLLLTGGKISGDLEVTGTLKIGEAVLSYQRRRERKAAPEVWTSPGSGRNSRRRTPRRSSTCRTFPARWCCRTSLQRFSMITR